MKQTNKIFLFSQCLFAIVFISILLYSYMNKHNETIELRLAIPLVKKEIRELEGRTAKLLYEVEQFESPVHLIELSRKPEFGHLKHPYVNDIVLVEMGDPLQ